MGIGQRGDKHYRFKNGSLSADDYRVIYVDGARVLEHRHIMEKHIGRKLADSEIVHHKNGDRKNNKLSNLELIGTRGEHALMHSGFDPLRTEKRCSTCSIKKPVVEFHKNRSTADGIAAECKTCRCKYQKSYSKRPDVLARNRSRRMQNAEMERAKSRSSYRKHKAKRKEYWQSEHGKAVRERYEKTKGRQAWKKRYYSSDTFRKKVRAKISADPNRFKARWAVNNAVRDSRLSPPSDFACVECGGDAKQYHHHNGYDKEHWLDVVPICRKCHHELHS